MSVGRLLLCILVLSITAPSARAQESGFARLGLYVVVSDLDRARAFYEDLFQKKPYIENASFVGFDVGGGLYGLFLESAYTARLVRGNSTVPYIRVNDIEGEFGRVGRLASRMISKEIVTDGPIRLFMFADPDGNVVEFFSVTAAPAVQ